MTSKIAASKKSAGGKREAHELQQDDFGWLAEFRTILSPYWSSRVEYDPEKKGSVLVLEDTRPLNRG